MLLIEENMKKTKNKRGYMNKKIKNMLLLELGIIFLVLIIFIAIKLNIIKYIPTCIIKQNFGILCPSCGGTRCVTNLILGNFKESFLYHPVFFVTIIYLVFANIIYIVNSIRKKEILTFLYPKTKFWIFFVIVIGVFTILRNIL